MKKIILISLLGLVAFIALRADYSQGCNQNYNQDYYDEAPYCNPLQLSKKKAQSIIDLQKEKEHRKRIAKNYKEYKEEKLKEEQTKDEEPKKIELEKETPKKTSIEELIIEEPTVIEEPVKKETSIEKPKKLVSGIEIKSPFVEVDELSAADKKIANDVIKAIDNGEESLYLENDTFSHAMYVAQAVQDTYFYSYMNSEIGVLEFDDGHFEIVWKDFTKENLDKSRHVSSFIKSFGNQLKGLSELEAVTRINNWLKNNITYEQNTRDLYSLIYNKVGNCDSYSQFLEYVCDYIGIECKSVEGYIIGVDKHMWSRVNVDNVWYYIDTTLNQTYDNAYFLSTDLWHDSHVEEKSYKRNWTNDT